MISWVICGVLLLGYPAFWLERRRHTRVVFERGHALLTQHLGDLQQQLEQARETTHRYQLKIGDTLAERDRWVTLYYEESIGHGNAQDMMMGLINRMGAKLQQAGAVGEIERQRVG